MALKICVWRTATVAVLGEMRREMPADVGVMVIAAELLLVLSATEVAVSVTDEGLGTFAGAV